MQGVDGSSPFIFTKKASIQIRVSRLFISTIADRSATKQMVADPLDDRAGADPGIGGFGGIIIVDGTAGGIPAIECIAGSVIGGVADGLIELPVGNGGKGTRLIDHAGQGIGKGRVLNAIQNNGAYCNLSGIVFAACFC